MLAMSNVLHQWREGFKCVIQMDHKHDNILDGFGGLVVSMLAFGTQVCGFKPGRSLWIFTDVKSSACLPPEGK